FTQKFAKKKFCLFRDYFLKRGASSHVVHSQRFYDQPSGSEMTSTSRLRYLEAKPSASARLRGTLVLLHAFPMNARMWEPQLAMAENGWRVLAPHFRGMDDPAAAASESTGHPAAWPTPTVDDY